MGIASLIPTSCQPLLDYAVLCCQALQRIIARLTGATASADQSRDSRQYDPESLTKAVFVGAFIAIMVGCGILSSFQLKSLRRRTRNARHRRSAQARRALSNHVNGTVTSSGEDEDEDYDSNGSLHHGTEAGVKENETVTPGKQRATDARDTDPGLLRKHSSNISYTTSIATYAAIRTFYSPHPHMNKLPTTPAPIPLLVFVHGLGGSLAQFHHLLTSLSNVGPCFGIDLPGCGLSEFSPLSWDAYSVEALAELLATAIEQHRDREAGQGVILIGHSLGCSLSALIASSASSIGAADLKAHILGFVAVCPKATPPTPQQTRMFRRLLSLPEPIFDLWRSWDRRGGPNSVSVLRFVGPDADPDTRELQLRFNAQSKTPVWRRMAWGTLPAYENGKPIGGMPGETIWAQVRMPVLLVAGESDAVTRPEEVEKILTFFGAHKADTRLNTTGSSTIPDASAVHDQIPAEYDRLAHDEEYGVQATYTGTIDAKTTPSDPPKEPDVSMQKTRSRIVKSAILPAPASHALLYDRATYRTLAGIIQDFLHHHIDERLNLGWQLQYMNTSGKWDVKNLAKWKKVTPVSKPIGGTFVALKMLREVDEEHNPVLFAQTHKDQIYAVIDISHENPVYNPAQLEKGGIHYHKHPTVSKIPPTPDETRDFIALVDGLQAEITKKMESTGDDPSSSSRPLVGVHCHYGFNRTGFLIVCYLIERRGFSVQGAIDEFEKQRPPGIRHAHFIDTLFVRYCIGLKRAPTL